MKIVVLSCFLVVFTPLWTDKVSGYVLPELKSNDQTISAGSQDTNNTSNVQTANMGSSSVDARSGSQMLVNNGTSGNSSDTTVMQAEPKPNSAEDLESPTITDNVQTASRGSGSAETRSGSQPSVNNGTTAVNSKEPTVMEAEPKPNSADLSDEACG
jgi:hypothetical protein